MLRIDADHVAGVLTVEPDGALTESDIERLAAEFDKLSETGGRVHGVLIRAKEFPGWANGAALRAHVRFVRGHHRRLDRIAVSTDSLALRNLPRLARWFISPEVEVFRADEHQTASEWVRQRVDQWRP